MCTWVSSCFVFLSQEAMLTTRITFPWYFSKWSIFPLGKYADNSKNDATDSTGIGLTDILFPETFVPFFLTEGEPLGDCWELLNFPAPLEVPVVWGTLRVGVWRLCAAAAAAGFSNGNTEVMAELSVTTEKLAGEGEDTGNTSHFFVYLSLEES